MEWNRLEIIQFNDQFQLFDWQIWRRPSSSCSWKFDVVKRSSSTKFRQVSSLFLFLSLSLSLSLCFYYFFPSFLFVRFTSVVYKRRRHKIWPSLIGAGRIHTRNHQLPRSIILEPGRVVTSSGRLAFIAALPFDKSEPWCRERPVDGISAAFPSISLSLSLSLPLSPFNSLTSLLSLLLWNLIPGGVWRFLVSCLFDPLWGSTTKQKQNY